MQTYSCLHVLFLMNKTKDQISRVSSHDPSVLGKQNVQAKKVYCLQTCSFALFFHVKLLIFWQLEEVIQTRDLDENVMNFA